MKPHKVFCIGMFKTGTSSLGKAFDILGYRTLHGPWWPRETMLKDPWYEQPEAWPRYHEAIRARIAQHDAFEDYPWMFLYEQLDAWLPDARFILTIREPPDAVADSDIRMLRRLRVPEDQIRPREAYIERYRRHKQQVLSHFGDRDKLLVLDLVGGEGWERLCPFLGEPIPDRPFPHVNKAPSKPQPSPMMWQLQL